VPLRFSNDKNNAQLKNHMKQFIPQRLLIIILTTVAITAFTHRAVAQAGAVYTIGGGGTSYSDGIPATNALIVNSTGIGMDAAGNFYYADIGRNNIRRISEGTGLIYTVAGIMGASGYAGDGGPATAALLSPDIRGICVTPSGDIFITDDSCIRKVDAISGIITTVVGGGSSSADGVPATNASISASCVYVDVVGNIFIGTDTKIRKIDATTGLITTIAGNGSSTDSGDGGPAISAGLSHDTRSICMDNIGNLFLVSGSGDRIRKIDATSSIITTVAGGGGTFADGIPATNAYMWDIHSCGVDGAGNIFIADHNYVVIRRVDATTGIINTIAGMFGSASGGTGEGIPASTARINAHMLLVNTATGHIYYSDFADKIRKFSYTPLTPLIGGGSFGAYTSDSMGAYIYKQCSGPRLTVRSNSYHSGMTVRTYFGDGTADTSTISASWSGTGGYAVLSHAYPTSGTYTVQHILYNAGIAVDTLSYGYDHVFCSNMSVRFYKDVDINCSKSSTEPLLMKQVVTRVDSNGLPVDTLMATSGFNYPAYGNPGDVYTFRTLSTPTGLYSSCPSTGILYDTLHTGITTNATRYMALSCATGSFADLDVRAHVPVTGPNDQWGHIYVRNNFCLPADASVTLNFSPKYRYTGGSLPTPVSSTATSITWNISALSDLDAGPRDIYFVVWHNPAVPYPTDGDTVNERIVVTPTSGPTDINMANNIIIRTDTVRTSCDPNTIEVKPACFDNDTTLHFTVHFENIGSAPAVNIYVMDTLSPFLDPATFSIDMSTHPMIITKQFINNKTIFKFDFPNINLADSSDHANRDGMFMYTIRNRPSMGIGLAAYNRVGIYFDYNDVLMTNTAVARKGCPVLPTSVATVSVPTFTIYPNPASDELTIEAPQGRYTRLTITNIVGQQLLQQDIHKPEFDVDVRQLSPGMYFVNMQGEGGSSVKKFVKK
jgi:uncharacterized repeat protein (TIGR01451 family)